MIRRIFATALAAFLATSTISAQEIQKAPAPPVEVAAQSAPSVEAEPVTKEAKLEALRRDGFARIYSLDYPGAAKSFEEIIKLAPELPQGYIYRATNTWFKSLFDSRLLSTSLYSRDEFYSQKERVVDPAVDRSFRADIQKAIELAETRMKADPKDIEAIYFLGAAHGALGGYEATMARAFLSALKHGNKALDLHEKVLKMDPKYADAYLTIGMYHYVVGSLPFFVKVLVKLGGVSGSKKQGLVEIERVAKEARQNSDEARVVLISLYVREARYDDALGILKYLQEKYPTNFVVGLEEANLLSSQKRFKEAHERFDRLLGMERAVAAARDYISYSYGESLKLSGAHDLAFKQYEHVWGWKGADPDLVTLARLGAGQCLDALGKRQEALAQYRIVLQRPDVLDSRKKAGQFTKKAYAPSSPMASTGQLSSAS